MLSILLLPLITVSLIGLFGRSLGSQQVSKIITFVFSFAFLLTNIALINYLESSHHISIVLFD